MSKSVAGNSANLRTAPKSTWRVVDIVVASVLSVAVGVIFWLWSAGYGFIADNIFCAEYRMTKPQRLWLTHTHHADMFWQNVSDFFEQVEFLFLL